MVSGLIEPMKQHPQQSYLYAIAAVALAALCVLPLITRDAIARAAVGSSYSSTAAANCWSADGKKNADDQSSRICRGKAGRVVFVNIDDLRETVSVGRNRTEAAKEPAAQALFAPFSSAAPRIEWRMAGSEPIAIIQRWQLADQADQDNNGRPRDKALLIVTRLSPGGACHVAYVDAAANPNANELARKAADETARSFVCGKDPVKIIGNSGRAVQLATQR
ncbi:MAG: hypothetical protein WA702_08850 [Bradyrhizobium sp.]|jgi:hypothetical protein|uniref:hypothetical protein n=1 Tax=Bradyrhizobium sp. TaxID=376 RepID=UPI003C7C7004